MNFLKTNFAGTQTSHNPLELANLTFADLIGFIGVGLIILTYFLSQVEKMDIKKPLYPALNALGAMMILYSLIFNFNAASVVIEVFWVIISLIGFILAIRRR